MSVVGGGSFEFPGAQSVAPELAPLGRGDSSSSPPTLKLFGEQVGIKANLLEAIAEGLGGDTSMSLEDFAFIDEEDYKATLAKIKLDGSPLTAVAKAQALRLYHQGRTQGAVAGLPVPGVIQPGAPTVAKETQPSPMEDTMLKQSAYLNQASEATFKLLNPGDLAQYRDNYQKVMGVCPPLNQRPTDEQLSALLALLATGRAPFADFAVFGPFDEVEARLRKYSDQVFVDGKLQTRLLHGPSTYLAWQGCWGVFKAAMIMLDAASLGALNQYEEGLRQLTVVYQEWSCIARAESTMRSTQWAIILEEARRSEPANFNKDRPWDYVIGASAFGVDHCVRSHWWWLHVTGPLSTAGSSGGAMAVANRIDGRPEEGSGPATKRQKPNRPGKTPQHPVASTSHTMHCFNWNDGKNCPEPCAHGRRHVCRWCGGPHRGVECNKGRGKGGAKSGGGGAGGGSFGKGGNHNNNNGDRQGTKKKRKNRSGKAAGKSTK